MTPEMLGNAALLEAEERVAFLSSRKIAAADVLRCCDWAESMRESEVCVMGGFQSPLEKDMLRFLLRGRCPVVLALARPLWKVVPRELRGALDNGRLLVVSPLGPTAGRRVSEASALARNRWLLEHCTRVVLGGLDPSGSLARLLREFPSLHPETAPMARQDTAN